MTVPITNSRHYMQNYLQNRRCNIGAEIITSSKGKQLPLRPNAEKRTQNIIEAVANTKTHAKHKKQASIREATKATSAYGRRRHGTLDL